MSDAMTSQSDIFPPLQNIQRLAISESGFVFDPVSGHNFTVNETGLMILRLLQKSTELQSLLEEIQHQYEISASQAERDILEFAAILRDYFGEDNPR